jgi:hypothetical protein
VINVGDDAEIARVLDGHEKSGNIREPSRRVNLRVRSEDLR